MSFYELILQFSGRRWRQWDHVVTRCCNNSTISFKPLYISQFFRLAYKLSQLSRSIANITVSSKHSLCDLSQIRCLRMQYKAFCVTYHNLWDYREYALGGLCARIKSRGYIYDYLSLYVTLLSQFDSLIIFSNLKHPYSYYCNILLTLRYLLKH